MPDSNFSPDDAWAALPLDPALDGALWMVRNLGAYVFPVRADGEGKSPCINAWHTAATNNIERIMEWAEKYHGCSWAWVPAKSGHGLVDIDVKNPEKPGFENLKLMEAVHGVLPATLRIRTPSGGEHRIFATLLRTSTDNPARGLDIRGGLDASAGLGYALCFGSMIASTGRRYELLDDQAPAEMPDAWRDAINTPREVGPASIMAGDPIDPKSLIHGLTLIPPSFDGEVIATADGSTIKLDMNTWVGLCLGIVHDWPGLEGLSEHDRFRIADNFCSGRTGGFPEPETYHDTEELRTRLKESKKDGPKIGLGTFVKLATHFNTLAGNPEYNFAAPPAVPSAETFGPALAAALPLAGIGRMDGDTPARARPAIKFYDPDELLDLAPPEFLIEGVLPAGGTALLSAPMGHYKTFVATEIAAAVATGKNAFGTRKVNKPGRVLYLTNEGFNGVALRMKDWCREHGIVYSTSTFDIGMARTTPKAGEKTSREEHFASIREQQAGKGPIALTIIDTVSKSLGGLDENSNTEMTVYTDMADALLAEFGCVVLSIAHQGDNTSKASRGATALPYNTETVMTIKADVNAKTAAIKFERMKDWEGPIPMKIKGRAVERPDQPGNPGMVFYEMSSLEASQEAGQPDKQRPTYGSVVGNALAADNIFGEGAAVSRQVCAALIVDYQSNNLDRKARDKAVQQTITLLKNGMRKTAGGQAPLSGYFDLVEVSPGKWHNVWFLPESARPAHCAAGNQVICDDDEEGE